MKLPRAPKVPLGNEKLKIETRVCDFTIQDVTTFKCQQIHQHLQNMGKDKIIFDCLQSLVSSRLAVTLLTSVNTSQDKSIFKKSISAHIYSMEVCSCL